MLYTSFITVFLITALLKMLNISEWGIIGQEPARIKDRALSKCKMYQNHYKHTNWHSILQPLGNISHLS